MVPIISIAGSLAHFPIVTMVMIIVSMMSISVTDILHS